jgi:hypothetical protein
LALACSLPLLAGCASGPDYAGGPSSDEPFGVVDPGRDINLWRVDGHDVDSRSGPTKLEPGRRLLKVRIEADIADDTPTPKELRDVVLHVEEGVLYTIDRKPGELPPWELDIRQRRFD